MDAKAVIKKLEANGFRWVRKSGDGSHRKYRHPDGRNTSVPYHGHKDLSNRVLDSIEKATGLSIRG